MKILGWVKNGSESHNLIKTSFLSVHVEKVIFDLMSFLKKSASELGVVLL